MTICDISKCTGCFSCMNACPKNAISVGVGPLDKAIPVIDETKCIHCGQCEKSCPVNHPLEKHRADCSYAAWSTDKDDLALSTSGGISAVFSDEVLENGGIVFGTTCENGKAKIVSLHSETEVDRIRGSKYVQSFSGMTYKEAKEYLEQGRSVLFFGTPCLIAGLLCYLKKDYENLITVDLICHGIPPEKYFQDHASFVLKNRSYDKVTFRNGKDYVMTFFSQGKAIYKKKINCDIYLNAFLKSLTFRDNCYQCAYSSPERCSDITIGDFWGINREKLEHPYDGRISVVLPNTDKGKSFFMKCSDRFVWEQLTVEEACNPKQENLRHPSIPSPDRADFEKYYYSEGFENAIRKHTKVGTATIRSQRLGKIKETYIYKCIVKIYLGLRNTPKK